MTNVDRRNCMKSVLFCIVMILLAVSTAAQINPTWMNAYRGGGANTESVANVATSVAISPYGSIVKYVAGTYNDSTTFGSLTLPSYGVNDVYVAKMSSNGTWLWATHAGGTSQDDCQDMCLYASSCFIIGRFVGTATFGSTTLVSNSVYTDIFIAEVDADGNWVWAVKAGGTLQDEGYAICADGNDDLYVSGRFQGSTTFGTTVLTSSGNYDIFVAKLSSSGQWIWAKRAGGVYEDAGFGLCANSNGSVFLTGEFQGQASFGTTNLQSSSYPSGHDYDICVAKLDLLGNWQWANKGGGVEHDIGYDIACDDLNNVYITGYDYGNCSFGTISLTTHGWEDVLVAKLDNSGNWLWAKNAGGLYLEAGYSIALDAAANVLVSGVYHGPATFGSTTFPGAWDNADVFIAKLDTNGYWLWSQTAGGTGNDTGRGISVITNLSGVEQLYIAGTFNNTASFSTLSLTSAGSQDVFIARINNPDTSIIPKAPQNLHLTQYVVWDDFYNPLVTWDPVTEDTWGRPLTPRYYNVYHAFNLDGPYNLVNHTNDTSMQVWCDEDTHAFIKVTAVPPLIINPPLK
jgi:hypothetical protein